MGISYLKDGQRQFTVIHDETELRRFFMRIGVFAKSIKPLFRMLWVEA